MSWQGTGQRLSLASAVASRPHPAGERPDLEPVGRIPREAPLRRGVRCPTGACMSDRSGGESRELAPCLGAPEGSAVDALIEQSSLGTEGAKLLRAGTSPPTIDAILGRVRGLQRR